ncbi:MAG TPA: hypothetical protein VM864_11810 [Pyrinomonadaceae bacterium]|jgi:heme/copper-type cytochrome/quinol oxidase subunit 3|nr:hypothetical protein [Pyrinomonadaceae bacterium]
MARSILAVIAGYVVFALSLFLAFTALYLLLGADASFKPSSYEPSILWLALTTLLGFVASVVGGYACAALARGGRAPLALAALVLVVGLIFAFLVPKRSEGGADAVRAGNVPNMEAMQKAIQPKWSALLNPFLGAAGVLVGGRLRRKPANG